MAGAGYSLDVNSDAEAGASKNTLVTGAFNFSPSFSPGNVILDSPGATASSATGPLASAGGLSWWIIAAAAAGLFLIWRWKRGR